MQLFRDSSSEIESLSSRDSIAFSSPRLFGFCVSVLLVAVGWVVALLFVHGINPRLLPSWHGFLHAAIATRFPSDTIPPENPFFAGEMLPYYWLYHYLGFTVAIVLETDLLHAFQLITLTGLVVLVIAAGSIGYKYLRSAKAGLLISYLALAGLNPLGPAIAVAKHFLKGTPLYSTVPAGESVENLFVSNRMADDWMTQPLLPAMHISSEWWHGQNLVWFIDISSRAAVLSLIMVALFFLLSPQIKAAAILTISLLVALITSLNPISGFALSGSIVGASVLVRLISRRLCANERNSDQRSTLFLALGCLAGPILALPAYYHLLILNTGTFELTSSLHYGLLKFAALSANFIVLLPLAVFGSWQAPIQQRPRLWTITLAGILLWLAVPLIVLWPHNEHNLTNVAQCLLAVPAAAWVGPIAGKKQKDSKKPIFFLYALFLPTTICTLTSYTGRPDLPLAFHSRNLQRVPAKGPLETFYRWARDRTPRDAVFIADPNEPVKMSGNVSELPAFTGRTLFIDHESYLTAPYRDAPLRAEMASRIANGDALTQSQVNYLERLRRRLFLVSFHADRGDLIGQLIKEHGAPVFRQDFVAVFELLTGKTR
jgi:Uncharacterized membrane protein (DUF2298)